MAEKVKKIYVSPIMTDSEADALAGTLLPATSYKTLITYDADVYCKETKKCIGKFRKKVIPSDIQENAFKSLLIAAKPTNNRGTATKKDDGKNASTHRLNKNGTISKTTIAAGGEVNSGIVGYFDRNPRFPYCRQTAFNQQHFDKFKKAYPIIKLVDHYYSELMPEEYKRQRELADKTSKDFVITNTAFTTVTVNKNWQTAVHQDAGDFKGGFGNLVALRKGQFDGGIFVVAKWGVGFDLQNGDLLLVDVHQWHGNTPIVKQSKDATRLSLVMYYRENMHFCGTAQEEVDRAKNRKQGEKLNA